MSKIILAEESGRHTSRHEKKCAHHKVSDTLKRVTDGVTDLTCYLQILNDAYIDSNQYIPTHRYRLLQQMIEEVTDDDKLAYIRVRIQEASGDKGDHKEEKEENEEKEEGKEPHSKVVRQGALSLEKTANKVADAKARKASKKSSKSESTNINERRPLVSGGKPYSRVRQVFRKGQKMAGLDLGPVEDEDVMTDEELEKSLARKTEQILHQIETLEQGLAALLKLKDDYEFSKQYQDCCCVVYRYFKLKSMIKRVIKVTKARSSFEDDEDDAPFCFGHWTK